MHQSANFASPSPSALAVIGLPTFVAFHLEFPGKSGTNIFTWLTAVELRRSLDRPLLPPICRSANEVDNGTNLSSPLASFG